MSSSYYCVDGRCYVRCDVDANPFSGNDQCQYERIQENDYDEGTRNLRTVGGAASATLGGLCDAAICISPNLEAVSKWLKRIGYVFDGADVALSLFDEGDNVARNTTVRIGSRAAENIGGMIGAAIGNHLLPGIGEGTGRYLGSMMASFIYDGIMRCFFGVAEGPAARNEGGNAGSVFGIIAGVLGLAISVGLIIFSKK